MKENIVLIGAGGHAKVCAEIAGLNGYDNILFLDDSVKGPHIFGKTDCFSQFTKTADFFVAIGDNRVRQTFFEKILAEGGRIVSLLHPHAIVSKSARIGKGAAVMAGAVINAGAQIGDGVVINTCSSVDHDCTIGNFAHISVGAHLTGTVDIGEGTLVGAGAVILNNLNICDGVVIGAGATVIKPITEKGVYVGTPAVKIK